MKLGKFLLFASALTTVGCGRLPSQAEAEREFLARCNECSVLKVRNSEQEVAAITYQVDYMQKNQRKEGCIMFFQDVYEGSQWHLCP